MVWGTVNSVVGLQQQERPSQMKAMDICSKLKRFSLIFIALAVILGVFEYLETMWAHEVTASNNTTLSRAQEEDDLASFQKTVKRRRELMLCQCNNLTSSMKVRRFQHG